MNSYNRSQYKQIYLTVDVSRYIYFIIFTISDKIQGTKLNS